MSLYDTLNDKQKEAVVTTEGPLLILAGAGSGKTRVLTHRIAYLIKEKNVAPWNIFAITFTNKAANEMKERVEKIVPREAKNVWVSTFHSACVRILRQHSEKLGYDKNFSIYDTDDQKTLMKEVFKVLKIDNKLLKERAALSAISMAKNEMISPEKFIQDAKEDFLQKKIGLAYREYNKQLQGNNALDFDDLLLKTVELFQKFPEILASYRRKWKYIMVDEYQDTNSVQFELIHLLAQEHRNLCVVGDDDQSIYKFRGANIKNILNFEDVFPDAKIIKLEENYRSTKNILHVANAVIANNEHRKEKTLWTGNEEGEKIDIEQFDTAYHEADFVVQQIEKSVNRKDTSYMDHAILYRTNAQSRLFEEKLIERNIPYKIIGGVNFYARREIKDLLAYLKTIANKADDLAVRRIINVPKRGIGQTTVDRVQNYAYDREVGFYEALLGADLIPNVGRALGKLESFVALIEFLKSESNKGDIESLFDLLLETTGYERLLEEEKTEEAKARLDNIGELKSKISDFVMASTAEDKPATLEAFLEEVALVADVDSLTEDGAYVVLMTLHSAKGLEYPYVYMTGMEEGLFPSYLSTANEDREELEEERRLCYVGMTRAMKKLTLTCARSRMIHGETRYNPMSQFLLEVPEDFITAMPKAFDKEEDIPKQESFKKAMRAFHAPAFGTKTTLGKAKNFPVKNGTGPGYIVGDRVRHPKFGEGKVIGIVEGGRDYEVTVAFDTGETRKMFAAFARMVKVEQ